MLNDLDQTLKQMMVTDMALDTNEVDVVFETPDSEWSGSLSRPTINCYLYHIVENQDLRQSDWELAGSAGVATNGSINHSVTRRRLPYRIDIHYIITVWTNEIEDEHRLLWRLLSVFMPYNNSYLPFEQLQGDLGAQEWPVRVKVVQSGEHVFKNPADFWSSMEVGIKPAVDITLTVPLDPEMERNIPLVLTKRVKVHQEVDEPGRELRPVQLGGWVLQSDNGNTRPVEGATVTLVEHGVNAHTDREGRFKFDHIPRGRYTLRAMSESGQAEREVEVPGPEYDLRLAPRADGVASTSETGTPDSDSGSAGSRKGGSSRRR